MNELLQLRQAFSRNVSFSETEWAQIHPKWSPISFEAGQMITNEGEIERFLYFILTGIQRMYFLSGKGEEKVLGFAYDGNFSGAFDSLVAQRPSMVCLEALTPCHCLCIPAKALQNLFDQQKCMERWGRLFLTDILTGRGKREIEMSTLNAEERYRQFMQRQPEVLKQVPQKYLASYLGMTPETFSRLRARVR